MDKILKTREIVITRVEANFDRACDSASRLSNDLFDIDDCGHSSIEGWNRSSCYVELKFISYKANFGMTGGNHQYVFEAIAWAYVEDET